MLANAPRVIPPYGRRKGWTPRTEQDYGGGGAYPEIHVAQYPLDMGRKDRASSYQKTVPVTLDSEGKVQYEALLNTGGSAAGKDKMILAKFSDMSNKRFDEDSLRRPDPEEEAEIAMQTKAALDKVVDGKVAAAQPTSSNNNGKGPTYIRYTPSQKNAAMNSGQEQRVIRLSEAPVDPMEPPKFKIKKAPRGPPSPPVPVMHSPPKKVTVKDQMDWKIPPCISNWKNNKGYTIPLDKRLAADGRGLNEVQINDNFAKLSEALYVAEISAREEVAKRADLEKRLKLREKEKTEEMLRKLAQEARMERAVSNVEDDEEEDSSARNERDQIREERRRERERDLRMQRNKSQAARNAERDISERVALGQAVPNGSSETLYDQRLFNQSQGMSSGFGDEDGYNIYSKPLFGNQSTAASTMLHRPKKDGDEDNYGGEEDYKKLLDTSKFKPDKEFSGARDNSDKVKGAPRTGAVEFETETSDPFGLDDFLNQAKAGSKLDKIGQSGHMSVSSGNIQGATEGGSKRGRIDFESSSSKSGRERDDKRRR